jgi:hypothetical protein
VLVGLVILVLAAGLVLTSGLVDILIPRENSKS